MRAFAQPSRPAQRRASSAGTRPHAAKADSSPALPQLGHRHRSVQRLLHGSSETSELQPKLEVNTPGDEFEQEADRVADQVMRMPEPGLQRACSCGGKCPECSEEKRGGLQVQTKREESQGPSEPTAPPIVHDVLASSGRPLDSAARAFMEPRFGFDFSQVRVHAGPAAAESARSVQARAYTVGNQVVFGEGQYAGTEGRKLLAHELTHVIQQGGGSGSGLRRSVVSAPESEEPMPAGEGGRTVRGRAVPPPRRRAAAIPRPEVCPPPSEMVCPEATTSPGAVVETLIFPVNEWRLDASMKARIDALVVSWRAGGGSVVVRVDGYASAEGPCDYNWNLSCRRAESVRAELVTPSDGSPGVPAGSIDRFAHGESAEAGAALAPNRQATISIPTPPPPPPAPTCPLPVRLGSARGCGGGSDFTHFDFPSLSLGSELKLAAWATAHGRGPSRWSVTNFECEVEMDGVLSGLAGGAGHAAFARFAAGTGGTATHGPGSTLGTLALAAPEFAATLAAVQRVIETQLAVQAASGTLDPCALSVTPPTTHFASRHFYSPGALKTIIGGTQGEQLFATAFTGDIPTRTYTIGLRFLLCDDFGVDEADLYAPGLFGFWVLQHERSASLYTPFINELDLPVTVSGTF